MKNLLLYIKNRIRVIIGIIIAVIIFMVIFYLSRASMEPLLYSMEISAFFLVIFGIIDYREFKKKYELLKKELNVEQIYEYEIPSEYYENVIEYEYIKLVNRLICMLKQNNEDTASAARDLMDYYAVWAHQIKTPISAQKLLVQTMENGDISEDKIKQIKQELFKIEMYVDCVMNYLRLEDMSNDFVFEGISLEKSVKNVVKRLATQFIYKKISIQIDVSDRIIYTDKKWFEMILEQLLLNSLKYTDINGKVAIYEQDGNIVIEDNGIGISKEDIPRIMERGYTGLNGRMEKKSSGIGLYLCKKAGDKLGIEFEFKSEQNIGTKVHIKVEQSSGIYD